MAAGTAGKGEDRAWAIDCVTCAFVCNGVDPGLERPGGAPRGACALPASAPKRTLAFDGFIITLESRDITVVDSDEFMAN